MQGYTFSINKTTTIFHSVIEWKLDPLHFVLVPTSNKTSLEETAKRGNSFFLYFMTIYFFKFHNFYKFIGSKNFRETPKEDYHY